MPKFDKKRSPHPSINTFEAPKQSLKIQLCPLREESFALSPKLKRMQSNVAKQYLLLNEKPVLWYVTYVTGFSDPEEKNMAEKQELLLHICCAPCGGGCVERLKNESAITPVLYYSNSNLCSGEEFERRLESDNMYPASGVRRLKKSRGRPKTKGGDGT